MFKNYQKIEKTTAVWTGARGIKVVEIRSVQIIFVRSIEETMIIILKDMLYVPRFLTNLVFVSWLWEKKVNWQADDFTLQIKKTDTIIGVCKIMRSLLVLQIEKAQNFTIITKVVKKIYQKPI